MIEISQYKYFKLWIQQYLHKPVKGIFILFYNLIFCKPSKLQRLKYLIFDIKDSVGNRIMWGCGSGASWARDIIQTKSSAISTLFKPVDTSKSNSYFLTNLSKFENITPLYI